MRRVGGKKMEAKGRWDMKGGQGSNYRSGKGEEGKKRVLRED